VIVVPSSAKSKVDLDQLYLQGTTGYYYMDRGVEDRLSQIEGVEKLSSQVFLASLRAECCSIPVQVIGFDPQTDFTVRPWIAARLKQELGYGEAVVGCKVSAEVGEDVRIYKTNMPVVARLDPTGTGLDTAIYCTTDTMAALLEAARSQGHDLKITGDAHDMVSAVYLKAAPGTSAEALANDINVHVRKVEAVQTKTMLSGVQEGLNGVSKAIAGLIAAVWALAFALLAAAFHLLSGERRREFAVLRTLGLSRRRLGRLLFAESLLVSALGGVAGIALAALVIVPFSTLIEQALGLPFLLPGAGVIALTALGTLLAVCVAGPLAAARTAHRLSHVDTGAILREVG